LVLDLVTLTLGVRGQEPNQAHRPGGTGPTAGLRICNVIRGGIQLDDACAESQLLALLCVAGRRFLGAGKPASSSPASTSSP
jgi:hypothetical protein